MLTSWNDYLSLPDPEAVFDECHRRYRGAFSRQREIIARIAEATRPKTVACLGAGLLNDIPYRRLVRAGATVHLVDWLPGIAQAGVARSIIERGENGDPACVYCVLGDDLARAHCRRFTPPASPAAGVCGQFRPAPEPPLVCLSFDKGEQPGCHAEDATGGYAIAFAAEVRDRLDGARTWKKAFAGAATAAKAARRRYTPLSIADASVDLVTSSMLISQFEHEPYRYFSRQAAKRLGAPAPGEARRLAPAMDSLRTALIGDQIERHCDEIERILAPGGRCFMSFEVFQYSPAGGRWFLVEEMHAALARLARRFDFDFDLIGEADMVLRSHTAEDPALVYAFVLAAKRR